MDSSIPFIKGQQVLNKNDPTERGIFTGRTQQAGSILLAEIQYPNGNIRFLPVYSLEALDFDVTRSLKEKLQAGHFGRIVDLKRLITFEKLKGTLHEIVYSMEAAQIDFYPYQFKPVLKFINSPTERLVIADEVGLGKTIEAGLIWMEMQARHQANRLLVVCPKILAEKWRDELRTKFLIDARITDFKGLKHEIDELKRKGPDHSFILIGTYPGLRPPKESRDRLKRPPEEDLVESPKALLLRELRFWNEEYFPLDMVIFDEAHYMRNQATTTFHLGEGLSSNARAVLCISATPVNNRNIDLHSLLKLIDEDFFSTQGIFEELIQENKPAVQAANALSQSPVNQGLLYESIQKMGESNYIKKSPIFERFLSSLKDLSDSNFTNNHILAQCEDYAEKLNIIGRYVNRTRRVQVKENRPVRDVSVLPVIFTQEEMNFYQRILKLVRLKCKKNSKPFHVFQVMGLQLMAASCLPALAEKIKNENLDDSGNLLQEAFGGETVEDIALTEDLEPGSDFLSNLIHYDFEENDSKFRQLRELLEKEGKEKIIIFSYYRATLSYLRRRLMEIGEQSVIMHGDVPNDQRWNEIDRFKNPTGPRILITSEVGSEGIDLQFCRILVNYDLPWNPMRIEQRIGRIDRVGQQAKTLSIVNFKVEGTIEERIHERLKEKIEDFSTSLGDIEDVIGKEVKKLTIDLLSNELTPEQEKIRIEEYDRVIKSEAIRIQHLEESGDVLIAFSDYVQRKIEEDRGKGRYIQPSELESYLADFFERNFQGTEISYNTPEPECLRIKLSEQARESLISFMSGDQSLSAAPLRQKEFNITFNREVLQRLSYKIRNKIHFINHLSPLIRWITKVNKDREHEFYKLSSISIQSKDIPAGQYLYRIDRWKLSGLIKQEKLAYGMIALVDGQMMPLSDSESMFQTILHHGCDWSFRDYDQNSLMKCYDLLEKSLHNHFAEEVAKFEAENTNIFQIKNERINKIFDRRISQDEQRIRTLESTGGEERVLRMAKGRLNKALENKAQRLNEINRDAAVIPELEEVAVGIINVES